MSGLTLRSLHPDDLDRVSEIESRLTGSPRRAFLEKRLAVATAMPDNFVTCAVLDGQMLAGYGYARIVEGEFGVRRPVAVLVAIGIDPACQGKGIGKMVMAGIEQRMGKRNIRTLQTQAAWSDHAIIGFFSATGFSLASGQIVERDTSPLNEEVAELAPVKMDGKWRVHSGAGGNHYEKSARDRIMLRSLGREDLAAVVRIDTKLTGFDRSAYYAAKFEEMLDESGIRISMAAEDDGIVTGFIMARVDYGDFGIVDKTAVMDTIGVHPVYGGTGVGHALLSQLLINLATLQVETVRTKVEHENFGLRNFLHRRGFKLSQRLLLTREIH